MLYTGTLLALSVYYLNYAGNFDEGDSEGVGVETLLIRIIVVVCIVVALLPIRLRAGPSMMILGLYFYGAFSYALVAYWHGVINDSLFLNTIIQLPVMLALVGTRCQIDYISWLKFIFWVMGIQVLIDILIWQIGASLWLSKAFVGGLGNPSSFGLLCVLGATFYIFHPLVGRERWVLIILLTIGAFQSKALFAVITIMLVFMVWISTSLRRTFLIAILGILLVVGFVLVLSDQGNGREIGFIQHKLMAVGGLLSLTEYDVNSSSSVSQRIEMHNQTFSELTIHPLSLIFGHLKGLPYWPMDSQLLTYLGSFGALFLILFLSLHAYWMLCGWRRCANDNGFIMLSLCIIGLIFLTNRILDYFPIAIIYFIIISIVLDRGSQIRSISSK